MGTGVDFLAVSLDSPRKEIHDRLRGVDGAYEKALEGLRKLVAYRDQHKLSTQIILNTVVSGSNFMDVPSMVSLARELEVNHIYFLGVDLAPASVSTDHLEVKVPALDRLKEVLDFLAEEKKKDDFINTSLGHLKLMRDYQFQNAPFPYDCLAGYTSLYVDTYGKIYPCNAFLERKKHIDILEKGKTLKDVWNSPNYAKWRNELLKCKACYWPCQHELNLMFNKI
jgi:MoaA/NifB/PqqE/SkfB family radical SAM enzyme